MKKALLICILLVAGIATKGYSQASPYMMINNHSLCAVGVILYAHDACSYTGACALTSTGFTMPAGSVRNFNDITSVNTSSAGPGWHSGGVGVSACSTSGGNWDGIKFGTGLSCFATMGVDPCISTATSATLLCACSASGLTATYTVTPTGVIVDIY